MTSIINLQHLSGKAIITSIGRFIALTIVFGLVYSQSPFFTSNQNQYFLHGLAKAGFGNLGKDWLANTIDPTPIFSVLVNWTFRIFKSSIPFYLYYILLLGGYLYCLLGISRSIFDLRSRQKTLIYLILLIVIHSAALRIALSSLIGEEWTYLFEGGLAGQRILGEVFQPSSFGVFLIISIYLFLINHRFLSIFMLALAASIHPTYLLCAGSLVLSFMLLVYQEERSINKALRIGVVAFIMVIPILIYVVTSFSSSGIDIATQAQKILVRFRIPHHALVVEWFDITSILQLSIILIGIWLVRKTKLFIIIGVPLVLGVILTFLQIITQNEALALLFPWRISSILVPIATSVILAYGVTLLFEKFQITEKKAETHINVILLVICILLMVIGVLRFHFELKNTAVAKEHALFTFVKQNKTPDDLYLVPTKMQEFRLATGAPIFVDFKSIPYQYKEVLEWYRRMQLIIRFYNEKRAACGLLAEFHEIEGITHVVIETEAKEIDCIFLKETYLDDYYRILKFTE